MKHFLLVFCLLIFSSSVFAQQFSQYNTGTLYDSFENPAQRTFIPDTSRMFAFNFLFPNLNAGFYITGNAQPALRSRESSSYYNTADLQIGKGRNNHLDVNANAYSIMFKVFSSLKGNQELGFSFNTKAEAKGLISDETIGLLNGPLNFPNNSYSNIINDNYYDQVYQQIGFTYREQIDKQFALGFKVSALSGVTYNKVDITSSQVDFNKPADAAELSFAGKNYSSGLEGQSLAENLVPRFRNPGASITIGATYKTEDGYTLQGNLKDLGFIHWNKTSIIYEFNNFQNPSVVRGLSGTHREDSLYNAFHNITTGNAVITDFSSHTNAVLEASATKTYWLDYDKQFKFLPTLIASKDIYYPEFTAALVTPVQYHDYVLSLTSSYNDLKLFQFGGQFMIKSANAEFFIGSERLYQTGSLLALQFAKTQPPIQQPTPVSSFTGINFFIGFSVKFGNIIEHQMNASYVPVNEEKGFLGRLLERIFPSDAVTGH